MRRPPTKMPTSSRCSGCCARGPIASRGCSHRLPAARAQARYVAGIRSFANDLDRARAALARDDTKGAAALLSSGRIVSATDPRRTSSRRAARSTALDYDLQDLDSAPVKTP